ncbi:MAG: gliding motility protein GldN [Paludibacter sp.]|nr:gliding motility protein GldN [Paludibacter sp.]
MKIRLAVISFVIILSAIVKVDAQEKSLPFFDKNGSVAIQTTQMNALADTIATISHRADDIVWSRIVYRIIDLRDKQNNQLYFPVKSNNRYKSLFRVILEAAVNDTLKAYNKMDFDIVPNFNNPIEKDSLKNYFVNCDWNPAKNTPILNRIIKKDPLTNQNIINTDYYEDYASKENKYVIQEIVFFNKHYSKMYTKIIAIAPFYVHNETNVSLAKTVGVSRTGEAVWNFFQNSVTCWFLFDELRPYLAKQYVIPNGNDTQRMTFDDFFAERLYSSYILGDSNMFNRMLLQNYIDPDKIRKEQKRIETEMMNVEQDLWEY